MQQNRLPRTIQFVIEPFEQPVSGADLRNDAIGRALQPITDVKVVSPQSFNVSGQRLTGRKSAPTLLAPDEACVLNFVKYIGVEKPDLLLIEGVGLLRFCEILRSQSLTSRPRLVLDCHNVESALLEESVITGATGLRRLWQRLRAGGALQNARDADRQAVRLFDLVLVPTQADRIRLAELVGDETEADKIRVVPNIAPAWALERLSMPPATSGGGPVRRLLFVGHLRYPPNVDAIDTLLHRIWPRLRSQFPDLRLVIAGRNPKRRIRRWIESVDGVELRADPPSLGEIYTGCDAAIVPLRLGGGSRLKILEALALGVPVIATTKAVEGLDLTDGRHWLKAEDPDEYVEAIRRLGQDSSLRDGLIREGRTLVSERYTQEALARTLRPIFAELLPIA